MRYDVENQERREVWGELRSQGFLEIFLRLLVDFFEEECQNGEFSGSIDGES